MSQQERAHRDLDFLYRTTTLLAGTLDSQSALDELARLAVPYVADGCIIDVFDEQQRPRQGAVAHAEATGELLLARLQQAPLAQRPPIQRVLQTGKSILISTITADSLAREGLAEVARNEVVQAVEPTAYMAVPLRTGKRVVGVLTFVATRGRTYGEEDLALAEELARRAALVIDNARAYESERASRRAAEAAERRLAFLADASNVLASSLDLAFTFEGLARLAVPTLGDWCLIDLAGDAGQLEPVAAAHVQAVKEPALRALRRRFQNDPADPNALGNLLQRHQSRPGEPGREIDFAAVDAEAAELVAEVGLYAWLVVPVTVRSKVMGLLTFAMASGGRSFTADDVRLAEDLGRRAALAVENARLYREAQRARAQADSGARRARFLSEAASVLASALDFETTVRAVPRLVVPSLAEACVLDLLDAEGNLVRVAEAATDPALDQALVEVRQRRSAGSRFVKNVLRLGHAEVLNGPESALLPVMAGDDAEPAPGLHRFGPRAALTLPLTARGRPLGALTLVLTRLAGRFGAEEAEQAEELGRRAAMAIENARLYREAQEASRLKDEFLGIVSHELRTPLNAIIGWTGMVRADGKDKTLLERGLATIDRNAKTLNNLIGDLLDVTRVITGKVRLEARPMELAPLVAGTVDGLRPAAAAKAIDLSLEMREPGCEIFGDPDRLQQVLFNLVSNAIKFTPEGGKVKVRLGCEGRMAEVQVVDTGEGMSADFLPHAFERFRQADSSATRRHRGLGIGLSIVRDLVELHGGAVLAESPGPGRGSTFTVQLPLLHAGTEEAAPRPLRPLASVQDRRVLVVDDEDDTREMVVNQLARAGAMVKGAASAEEAMKLVQTFKPEIIVSDLAMPGEDGFSLIRRIRALAPESELPVIALTAYARESDRSKTLEAGFNSHLTKPFEQAELMEVLGRLLPEAPAAARARRRPSTKRLKKVDPAG